MTHNSLRQSLVAKQAHLKDRIRDLQEEVKECRDELKSVGEALSKINDGQLDMFGGGD